MFSVYPNAGNQDNKDREETVNKADVSEEEAGILVFGGG